MATPLETPFLEWEWLYMLENSGSITARTGWKPQHLTMWSGSRLVAAAPLYVKTHSDGEFLYGHFWADLARRLGIEYYPKLIGMSPVTPVPGYRFLVDSNEDEHSLTKLMVAEIDRFCTRNRFSGCSFLFVDPRWRHRLTGSGFKSWTHQGYAWQNQKYRRFEDFLAMFNANQRRNIRREREKIEKQGVRLEPVFGDEVSRSLLDLMYRFYVITNEQYGPWGCKYLAKDFFDALYDHYRNRLLLMVAHSPKNQGLPVGMSMFVTKKDRLYGRYWGSFGTVDTLHFNACYYRAIEWAIANGIEHFDPGIGSQHKLRRGFRAVAGFSLYKFYEPRLQMILQNHIGEINRLEHERIDAMNEELPFCSKQTP